MGAVSATGIGHTEATAGSRHDCERAERLAALSVESVAPGTYSGYATGDDDDAPIRALHEMIERWRVAEWWSGRLTASRGSPAAVTAFAEARRRWPRDNPRLTSLVQLEPGDLPPVLIAWSCEENGRAICTASACGPTVERTARHVLRELYQMEFGLEISRHRVSSGAEWRNFDKAVLHRAVGMTLADIGTLTFSNRPGADQAPVDDLAGRLTQYGCTPDVRIIAENPRVFRASFRPFRTEVAHASEGTLKWPFYMHT